MQVCKTTQPTYSVYQSHRSIAMQYLKMILIYMVCITFINGVNVNLGFISTKEYPWMAFVTPFLTYIVDVLMLPLDKENHIPPLSTSFQTPLGILEIDFPCLIVICIAMQWAGTLIAMLIWVHTCTQYDLHINFCANFAHSWMFDIINTLYMSAMFLFNWLIQNYFLRLQNKQWESMKWLA